VVRNASTKQFQAVFSLQSSIKWCLTGTPIQNKMEDLASLIRFLRLPVLKESVQFRRHITSKVQPPTARVCPDFETLRSLLGSICLRRNKTVLPMLAFNEYVYELSLSAEEELEYNTLCEACLLALSAAVSGHRSGDSHHTVVQAILQLRLFCNNGVGIANGHEIFETAEMVFSLMQQTGETICQSCSCDILSIHEAVKIGSPIVTKGMRLTCRDCATVDQEQSGLSSMPTAEIHEVPAGLFQVSTAITSRYPTKLLALCDDLQHHQQQTKR
jgi:SWI/SNF-related matrix-associated actin-dependent regulator of chromatin subfamily A3